MDPRLALLVRSAAPHRFVPLYAAGFAYALGRADGAGIPASMLVLVLGWITFAAIRLWDPGDATRSVLVQSVLMAVAGSAAGAAVVILIVGGGWGALVVFLLAIAVEWLFFLPPLALRRSVPREIAALAAEGLLAPALGYASLQPGPGVPWGLLGFTLLVGIGLAVADYLPETGPSGSGPTLRDIAPPLAVAGGALVAQSAAIAIVLAGGGPLLRPELALLAVPVAVLATVFGWLALADPLPEARDLKVRRLVVSGGVSLVLGVVLVLVAA